MKPASRILVLFLVTCCGGLTMVLEFVLQRMLAIEWGTSVEVWGSTISVVLGGLALGYWLGGVVADRFPRTKTLGLIILALSCSVALYAFLAENILFWVAGWANDVRLGSLLGSLAVLLIPTLLLGSVVPVAVRLLDRGSQLSGRISGRVYALSTTGSIAGALAAAFFLLPAFQADYILAASALFAAALACIILPGAWLRLAAAAPACAMLLLLASARSGPPFPGKLIATSPSRYQTLFVVERKDGSRLLMSGTRSELVYNQVDVKNPDVLWMNYARSIQLWNCLVEKPRHITLLGGGAATLARASRRTQPLARVSVVELDPEVLRISRRHLALPQDPMIKYFVEDGRRFLSRPESRSDIILLDAYARGQLPSHMVTRQFFDLARARSPYLAMNLLATPNSQFTGSLVSTIRGAYPQVQVFKAQPGLPNSKFQNLIVLAGDRLELSPACLTRTELRTGLPSGFLGTLKPISVIERPEFTDQRRPLSAR